MKIKSKIKEQRGSITLYVLTSMVFFVIVLIGLFITSDNKIRKQETEIDKVQKRYERADIDNAYEEVHYKYISSKTPTVKVYLNGTEIDEAKAEEKESSLKKINVKGTQVTLKFSNTGIGTAYAYTEIQKGDKKDITGNSLNVTIGDTEKTIYAYIKYPDGSYSVNYTAVKLIKTT